jgi:hypothetical protein
MVLFRERVFFSLETEPEEETKKEKKETEPEEKKKRRKLNRKKKKKETKKEKKKKREKKMAGPNGNECRASNGSQDTNRAPVQMGVEVVEYDIGVHSSWLLCRESAELGYPPYSTVS